MGGSEERCKVAGRSRSHSVAAFADGAYVGRASTEGPVLHNPRPLLAPVPNAPDGAEDRPSDAYLKSAFDDAPIGIALVGIGPDQPGRFLRVNRALCALTGRSREALEATDLESILHSEDVEPDQTAMANLIAGKRSEFQLEQRLIHTDSHSVWVMANASLVRDESGKPLYCIRQLQDIEERKRFEAELGELADHDPLTGLFNRRGFIHELTHQMAYARRYGGGGAVLFLDIDDFKNVNDSLGHSVGDEVISGVARLVHERLRETDGLGRLGGDEFAVLLPNATATDAKSVAENLLTAVRDDDQAALRGTGRPMTISIGITDFYKPSRDLSAEDVLIEADHAMYAAKEAGKDRLAVASPANQAQMRSRVTWSDRVRAAVEEGTFVLHCQPIVDFSSDEVSQWELLLRLPGDNGELIQPAQFLYTAERSGLILEIDRWVTSQAMQLVAEHQAAGRDLRLEVNLSGRSVADIEMPGFIAQQVEATGIDPASLIFEVTEAAAIANMDRARKFAAKLTDIGCSFALDDFGAGFGSFYYIKYIPFDYVKIDGEFIRHLPASSTDQLILDSIVQMSKGMGKRTIAEFVGDSETVELLREHGVDFGQGYHLGRPQPLTEALVLN
jgi:diguanylate cyclase (GGDEF)-like protein/PAS domain S-box-containing protein